MFTPHPTDLLLSVVLSAGLGALIGVVRQWTDWAEPHRDVNFGGARTFALWALIGCLGAASTEHVGGLGLAALMVAIAGHQVVAMARLAERRTGATSFAAVMLTVLTGALMGWAQRDVAIVVASVTAVTLGVKQPVHDWTKAFTRDDVTAALQFVAVTGVILPLVPNRNLGPLNAFNPYTTWLLVVLISAVGLGGYIAIRLLGSRAGMLLTALLGGIASSTATTLAFSRRSRESPELSGRCALGVVIASAVMFVRVVVIIAVINSPLSLALIEPLALVVVPSVLAAAGLAWWHRREDTEFAVPTVSNPLSLKTAITFGVVYAVIATVVKAVRDYHWTQGLLPVSFISGLTNMDAIALSLARGGEAGADALHGTVRAVLVATIGNTVFKAGVAVATGSSRLRRDVALALGMTALVGVAVACWV